MGSGRDKRKKVKDKQKQKEDAEARRERDKLRAAGGGGIGGSSGLIPPEDEKATKKSKKLSEEKELAAMILEIRKRDAGRQSASIEPCAPPTPRLNASLTHVNGSEVLMFGGEHYDGNPVNTHVFNELYRWNVETKMEYHLVHEPTSTSLLSPSNSVPGQYLCLRGRILHVR